MLARRTVAQSNRGVVTILDRFRLDGRRALVTGASRGIGRAIALGFAQAGADVALLARSEAGLRETAAAVEAGGRAAVVIPVDVQDAPALQDAVRRAADALGGLDILVNNAGVNTAESFESVTASEFDRVLNVNFRAPVFAIQAAGPIMRASGGGVILNIGSIAAAKGVHVYGASKAALQTYTRAVSRAWADDNIRCVAIAPGQVDTDMTAALRADPERQAALNRHTARRRAGTVEEIAAAAVYLCSDAADFVTGTVLEIDGGRSYFGATR
jgi:2-deoxy-D-gluconate 3-dehydrogenase